MASAAAAFDALAETYDAAFGTNPVGLMFRHAVQERLLALFPRGARVLDLGCGTGEDALVLAAAGRRVHGVDVSAGMVARARAKAEVLGLASAVTFAVESAEDDRREGPFDGAYSDFGALNCADLGAAGASLARALSRGAPVVLSLLGPRPLPDLLRRALTGAGEPRGARPPVVGGLPVRALYPSLDEARAALGTSFAWTRAFALGVLVPDPSHEGWVAAHPQAFGALAAVESLLRAWPGLRGLGDHVVLEGRRR